MRLIVIVQVRIEQIVHNWKHNMYTIVCIYVHKSLKSKTVGVGESVTTIRRIKQVISSDSFDTTKHSSSIIDRNSNSNICNNSIVKSRKISGYK